MNHYLSSSILAFIVACGSGTTTGSDGGTDASSDATQQQDANPMDGAADAPSDGANPGDGGGLQSGANCDPNNNLCMTGLLCCSEPTHQSDPLTAYFCEKPVNKGCPMFP
jgi:hypothetical protein